MRKQQTHLRLAVLVTLAITASTFIATVARAGKLYYHQQRTCTKCLIPKQNYGHDTKRVGAVQLAVLDAAVGDGGSRRRMAHFRATALTVDHLQLDQVGMAVYQADGRMVATGRITHNGVGLIGNHVTLRIRALVANGSDPSRVPPDAVVVWESSRQIWVPQGKPQSISLVPPEGQPSDSGNLRKNFDLITHLEVEMDYQRDR